MLLRQALRLYFYLLARGVVRERELCEVLACSQEELVKTAQILKDSAISLRTEDGFWLEDDDVFSFLLSETEADTLKDFQRLLRQRQPKLQRRLSDIILLRAAADDLLVSRRERANREDSPQLDELLERAAEEGFSLIVRFEDSQGEDVKELHIGNVLRTEDTAMILAEDLTGRAIKIRSEDIIEAYLPTERRKTRCQVQMRAETLSLIAPFLEEESTITARGREILLTTRVKNSREFLALIKQYDPQAKILAGGDNDDDKEDHRYP